jgi:nicotinate-nucleotide adenylyltransferase
LATLTTPVGILGGTFDPIHNGHLRLAEEVAGLLDLTQIRFIPTGTPPHRAQPAASNAQRAEMVRLAIADNPRFVMDERELVRAGQSYSFDTVTELRSTLPPRTPVVLMMGADAFLSLPGWHRWRELLEICHIVVAQRPGSPLTVPQELGQWLAANQRELIELPFHPLDVSANEIRNRITRGESTSDLIPEVVAQYISEHGLYRQRTA